MDHPHPPALLSPGDHRARSKGFSFTAFHLVLLQTQGRSSGRGEQGDGGRAAGEAGQQQQQQQLGIRESMKAKAESDLRDRKAREEEMSPGATLKVAALWLVLISQVTSSVNRSLSCFPPPSFSPHPSVGWMT